MRRRYVVGWCVLSSFYAAVNVNLSLAQSGAQSTHGTDAAGQESIDSQRVLRFSISTGSLHEALAAISEQSGWQIVYEDALVSDRRVRGFRTHGTVSDALNKTLARTGLQWSFANDKTIVVRASAATPSTSQSQSAIAARATAAESAAFSDIEVRTDAPRARANEISNATFGFNKPLLETPRSVAVIDDATIDRFELSAVEDLVRVVPGVFTTTRFGIQGSVDIRNVPADTYFRGMKRLTLQGHGRSVLAAMDSIEVIGGPASPLYGMGKIGGYTNMVPKSGRAKTGGYLTDTQSFVQASFGDYDRKQFSAGIGGPLDVLQRIEKRGGYYLYGLVEDSGSYTDGVPIKQRILQAAVSIDEAIFGARLETGASYQQSMTAGALTGRLTQSLVDDGRYLRGVPLANLDLNGNGSIGYLEMQGGSPVLGALSTNNQPLLQTWAWPRDSNGRPLPLAQFPQVPGIPKSLFDYLTAHPEADPGGVLRAQGVGGPVPLSGYVPIGMALDPRTIGYDTLNLRRAAAFERELQADFLTVFFDLIWDDTPGFAIKNQMFFDGMDQYKTSNQPFSTTQTVYVWEDKLTLSQSYSGLPQWLRANGLFSFNYRNTVSLGKSLFGDFSSHRTDAMASTWVPSLGGMTPNTTFSNGFDNPDLYNDGYPWGGIYRTEFSEYGVGALFDIDIGSSTNVILGGRIDGSHAKNVDYAGIFIATTGTSSNPGRYTTADAVASNSDHGGSWSASISQQLPMNLRPYLTYAKSSIVLDANNNMLTNVIINAGHLGSASLFEAGIKGDLFDSKLFATLAAYEQKRLDADANDDPSVLNAYASATRTRGAEMRLTASWTRSLQTALYALHQHTYYEPNVGATLLVDARTLGFKDVVNAAGQVIYPAEAFLYGGRSRVVLPAGLPQYAEKQGNPNTQVGVNASYDLPAGFGITVSGTYFSATCSGRLCVVTLPESYVFNFGAQWSHRSWLFKLDVFNITDERYFRARTGDTLGDVLAQAMPDRHWQATVKKQF
jgi:outer membrane receptor protein involved in Fe transport